ncbi:thymidylate kinase [Candidatus Woesearchaeota archaeon]|nr:thymidylate kinase [Candidatus Woesearchaeota archaeon]
MIKMSAPGKFIVVDGLDGVGKGVILDTLIEEAKRSGKRVFDVHEFWKSHDYHPPLGLIFGKCDVIVTSEPTYVGIGRIIRQELIAKNNRDYTPEAVAEAYALDRRILYQQLVLPALEAGISVYQSRSFSTSLVYQQQSAIDLRVDLPMEKILRIPGNAFCYAHPMNYLLIPNIVNVEEVLQRISQREKDDKCKFENLEFQLKLKKIYDSEEFRSIFRQKGVQVVDLDAGISIEHTQEQAREFYMKELR